MKVFVVVELPDIRDKIENGEKLNNFEYIRDAQSAARAVDEKIKSFMIENQGQELLSLPTKKIFQINTNALEAFEQAISGYQESLKTPISVGIGQELKHAQKAAKISEKTRQFEFWHPDIDRDMEDEKDSHEMNEVPDKAVKVSYKDIPPPSLEEEVNIKEQFYQGMAAPHIKQAQQEQMQQAQQEQMQQKQDQVQEPKEEDPYKAEEKDFRDILLQEAVPQQEDKSNIEKKSEQMDSTEMDPSKSEDFELSSSDKLAGLLSTIKLYLPDIIKLAETNPEAFKMTMKFIDATIRMAKNYREQIDLKKTSINIDNIKKKVKNSLKKVTLGQSKKRGKIKIPVGARRGNKIKVKDSISGREFWRSVSSGMLTGPDGQPISTKVYNQISAGNELGKKDLELLYQKLEKAETPPKKIGQIHPTKPYVAKQHGNIVAWYYNDQKAKEYEDFVNNNKDAYINKFPKNQQGIVKDFINRVLRSGTKHAVIGVDKSNPAVRLRHLKFLMEEKKDLNSGKPYATLSVDSSGKKINFSAVRHGEYEKPPGGMWAVDHWEHVYGRPTQHIKRDGVQKNEEDFVPEYKGYTIYKGTDFFFV